MDGIRGTPPLSKYSRLILYSEREKRSPAEETLTKVQTINAINLRLLRKFTFLLMAIH